MKGKLLVIEGIDGSGKLTQVNLLFNYLKRNKNKVKLFSFPRYDQFYGKLVGRILKGEFGNNNLSPYLTSLPFAMDRLMARDKIFNYLKQGYLVLMDRYVTSSLVHQAGKFKGKKQNKFIKWLVKMEYEVNKMPKEDMVLFLDVSVEMTQKMMGRRGKKDVAEKDVEYQKRTYQLYKKLVRKFKHWKEVECVKDGKLFSKTEIHQKIISKNRPWNLL